VLEKALKYLLQRKQDFEIDTLKSPPQSLEKLQFIVGSYAECCALIQVIEEILEGKEDEI